MINYNYIFGSPPGIGSDPADVLAPPEAPVLEAQPAQVQAVARAAPQEHEAAAGAHLRHQKYLNTREKIFSDRAHLAYVERHDLVPVPELDVGHPVGSAVLLQGRLCATSTCLHYKS